MGTYLLNAIGAYILVILIIGLIRERRSARPFESWLQRIGPRLRGVMALFLAAVGLRAFMPSLAARAFLYLPAYCDVLLGGLSYFIHEGGHFVLQWAPRTVHMLGGTLFQLGFPAALCLWYLRRKCHCCAALALFWVGHELPSVGRYIADARALQLDGLAPDGIHDWHWLLGEYGLLELDKLLGFSVQAAGALVMISACVWFTAGGRNNLDGRPV